MLKKNNTRLLNDWRPEEAQSFGNQVVSFQHSLHYSELFQDLVLAELLENTPTGNILVTAGTDPWFSRHGTRGNLKGLEILQAVRHGKLSVQIRHPERVNPAFRSILEILHMELKMALPDANINRNMMKIQISSPGLVFPMCFNTTGQALWQVRGERLVSVYPSKPPFISPGELETALIQKNSHCCLAHSEWFEQFADKRKLTPGLLLHWPFHQPYRIVNSGLLNVSVVTHMWSDEERKIHNVNLGNAVLRRMGMNILKQKTVGPAYQGKKVLAGTRNITHRLRTKLGKLGNRSGTDEQYAQPIDFMVEPNSPEGIRDLNRIAPW